MLQRLATTMALAAVAAIGCGRPALPASTKSPLLGRPLPSLELRALDGRVLSRASLAGKTVVVKFFAQYCEPCTRTLPVAQALSEQEAGVLVIGVAEDEHEGVVRATVDNYGLTFPVIHDRGRVVAGRFRVSELPATFVSDADGTLRWVGGPEQRPSDLEQAVEAVAR